MLTIHSWFFFKVNFEFHELYPVCEEKISFNFLAKPVKTVTLYYILFYFKC